MKTHFLAINISWILLVVTVSQKSCKINEPPSFKSVDKISITEFNTKTMSITSNLNFNNPNDIGLSLCKMELSVLVNGKPIGSIAQQKSTRIGARSDFSIPIRLDVLQGDLYNALGGFTGSLGAMFGKEVEVAYKGKIKLSKFFIPYTIKIDYTSKYKL